jgi:vitamin K-dependent gamma-carboxylase
MVRAMGLGSTLLDLSMAFLLLHRRTRTPAFAVAVAFHFMNARLFEIGIFPWMMIVATTVFFDPDWPRVMARVVRRERVAAGVVVAAFAAGFVVGGYLPKSFVPLQALIGGAGVAVLAFRLLPARMREVGDRGSAPTHASPWRGLALGRAAVVAMAVWVAVQVVSPLRHLAIPGNVQWTEEGQRFSWHLLVQSKSFAVRYEVTDPASGRSWIEDPRRHLTPHQISKLNDPDLLFQFAAYVDDYYERMGRDVEVRAEAVAQLNGRTPQHFVEPIIDLSSLGRPYIPPAEWIVPLEPDD